jgi:hypothetical protein
VDEKSSIAMFELHLPIAAWIFFAIAQAGVGIATVALYAELSDVNRKLPDDQQISYFWWYWSKALKLDAFYRQYYPEGRLILLRRICYGVMAASMIACAWTSNSAPHNSQ